MIKEAVNLFHEDCYWYSRTHMVIIQNIVPGITDSKTFSIVVNQSNLITVHKQLKEYMNTVVKQKYLDENIIINDSKTQKNSHLINIISIDKSLEPVSRSFLVKLHNYSSEEVAKEASKFLCKGKCYF